MMNNLEKIQYILDSDISAYEIATITGISRQNINKYRRGDSEIEKMSIENGNKLSNYYNVLVNQGRFPSAGKTVDRLENTLKFDALDDNLKALLIIQNTDERALTPKLQGYHLRYNKDNGFFYCQIHSGVGSGHPVFEFSQNTAFIIPIRVFVSQTAGTIIETFPLDNTPVEKSVLYQNYSLNPNKFNETVSRIARVPELTKNYFDLQHNRIKLLESEAD